MKNTKLWHLIEGFETQEQFDAFSAYLRSSTRAVPVGSADLAARAAGELS